MQFAICNFCCAEPGGELDARHAALAGRVDALSAELAALQAAQHPFWADALLGLVPNDPAVDNGAILTAAIRAGKIDRALYFSGGAYYSQSTLDDCAKEGLAFFGGGKTIWRKVGAYRPDGVAGPAPVIWLYNGPAVDADNKPQPALRVRSVGFTWEGINIFRGWQTDTPAWMTEAGERSIGIEGGCVNGGPPSGKWVVGRSTIAGFDTAIRFPLSNHQDNIIFDVITSQSNRVTFHCSNNQTAGIEWRMPIVVGPGEVFLLLDSGGNFTITTPKILNRRLFLRTGDPGPGSNTCTIDVIGAKFDNNSAGWRLVEMEKPGPLNLTISGQVGKNCPPAAEWITLDKPYPAIPTYTQVTHRLWLNGRLLEATP